MTNSSNVISRTPTRYAAFVLRRSTHVLLFSFGLSALACSDAADGSPAGAGDSSPADESAPDDLGADGSPSDTTDALAPSPPATLAERGSSEVRLIAHLHSAFSHDGCDDQGLDADGNPNLACVHRMKRALCSEHIALAYMTDHPSHVSERAWDELFYAEPPADDVVLTRADGTPWAVRYACDAGEGGPDGRVTLMVGFEGTHTMPLGLRRAMDWDRYVAFEDATPASALVDLGTTVGDLGGHLAIAHSEEDGLSAETIAGNAVAAMELYNFHANFTQVLGGGLGEALFSLESFLDPYAALPDPDLTALIMLDSYPVRALDKWRAVTALRFPITAFAGSDVHENASFAPACKDTDACDGIARLYPNLVAYLKRGGPIWQSDGERLDGYARIFRWVQNRVLVPPGEDPSDPEAIERAFFGGANTVVFEVLGDAQGYALVVESPSGHLYDPGQTAPLEGGTTLWARSPEVPRPGTFADWTDGSAAEMESIVWRTDASGTDEVARWVGAATWRSIRLSEPGVYQLEVLLTPRHLASALGPAADLAARTYRWVESNAIRVQPQP